MFGRMGARGGFGGLGALGGAGGPLQQLQNSLVSAGVWSLLDSFYLLAQSTSAQANIDLIKPTRSLTVSGTPTFAPNRGYTGDGVSAYLDTLYDPSTNAVNLSQNSNFIGVWSLSAIADPSGAYDYGQTDFAIAPYSNSKSEFFARGAIAAGNFFPQISGPGLFSINRNLSPGFDMYIGGGKLPPFYNLTSASKGANIYVSGSEQQGATTDGTNYYTTQTGAEGLFKRNASWTIIASNTTPLAGVSGTVNHIGASVYYNGQIYAPVANYNGSAGPNNNNQIAGYSATSLALVTTAPATMRTALGTLAGLAVDTTNGVFYGVDYLDPTVIYRFDINTLVQLSSLQVPLAISSQFSFYQGIAYINGTIILSATPASGVLGPQLPTMDLNGNFTGVLNLSDFVEKYEGIFVSGTSLGIMSDNQTATAQCYFYTIPSGQTTTISQASGSLSSGTMTVFKRNGGSAFSSNRIGAVMTGGAVTAAQIAAISAALQTYGSRVGAF